MLIINSNFINFLLSLKGIKGASFVGIKNYFVDSTRKNSKCIQSGYKNITININVDYVKMKNNSRTKLLNLNKKEFYNSFVSGKNEKFTFELFEKAFNSVFDQCTIIGQTLSNGEKKVEKTNQQKGQENAYTSITNGLRIHNETKELHISGVFQSSSKCEGLPSPLYKSSTPQTKTLIQNIIKKELNLKNFDYKTMILKNTNDINLSKTTFNGKTLTFGML